MSKTDLAYLGMKFGILWALYRQWGDKKLLKQIEELAMQIDRECDVENG